jgi:hypothetical protein
MKSLNKNAVVALALAAAIAGSAAAQDQFTQQGTSPG